MVSDFIFHLRDNQAYLRDVKPPIHLLKLFCLFVPKFALLFISIILIFGLFWVLSVQNNTDQQSRTIMNKSFDTF